MGPTDSAESRAGVWSLAGDRAIIADPEGPATILVPSESVRLLAVDLPLASRAKRLEALPFAVEDLIADSIDAVHLALGAEIAPRRYLVGVVRHELIEAWVDRAADAGLAHAAMVPDALALPTPGAGEWAVELTGNRALVRSGDGTGFAVNAALLRSAWEAAGRPPVWCYGAAVPEGITVIGVAAAEPLGARLAPPALDLRQGRYARRRGSVTPGLWRRVGWIVGIAIVAHSLIAAADTVMMRVIADRREAEVRELAAVMLPGTQLGEDMDEAIVGLLKQPGAGAGGAFVPLANRVAAALVPVSGVVSVRGLRFEGGQLIVELDARQPGVLPQIEAALRNAQVKGAASESPDGVIRVTASLA